MQGVGQRVPARPRVDHLVLSLRLRVVVLVLPLPLRPACLQCVLHGSLCLCLSYVISETSVLTRRQSYETCPRTRSPSNSASRSRHSCSCSPSSRPPVRLSSNHTCSSSLLFFCFIFSIVFLLETDVIRPTAAAARVSGTDDESCVTHHRLLPRGLCHWYVRLNLL